MDLLILLKDDWSKNKRFTSGQIIKKDGSVKNFTLIPNKAEKLEFEYGDKLICVHGSFFVIVHDGKNAHFTMFDAYWMPNHEVVLTEEFLNKNRVVHGNYSLPGTNDRVVAGGTIR